jgi:membrane-associated protein
MEAILGVIDNQSIIQWGGFAIIIALVYIETALLIGLVVPGGETLLFTAGLLSGTNALEVGLEIMIPVLIVAAFLGDLTGYSIGRKWGKRIYKKEDTWYFKKRHLKQAESFYKKHGKSALILGRFLPIIRTFNPLFSGTIHMSTGTFMWLIFVGIVLYISSITALGYFLGSLVPGIEKYLKFILPAIVIIALIPVIRKFRKERKKSQ